MWPIDFSDARCLIAFVSDIVAFPAHHSGRNKHPEWCWLLHIPGSTPQTNCVSIQPFSQESMKLLETALGLCIQSYTWKDIFQRKEEEATSMA